MTLQIEVAPETEAWLQARAAATGQPLESLAGQLFAELIEDLQDIEEARRALAEPGDSIPWEQVKAEIQADRAQREAA
jgi:hypothetical protein